MEEKKEQTVDNFLDQYTPEAVAEDMIILIMSGDKESAKQSLSYLQRHTKDEEIDKDSKKDKK